MVVVGVVMVVMCDVAKRDFKKISTKRSGDLYVYIDL